LYIDARLLISGFSSDIPWLGHHAAQQRSMTHCPIGVEIEPISQPPMVNSKASIRFHYPATVKLENA
jgi:hypothetical protein